MISDDSSRGNHYSPGRKQMNAKHHSYSPSSNYSYGNQNAHGNSNYGNQAHPQRRKPAPFKRDSHHSGGGTSDRLLKQNDTIIRILKEIRDRLPPPPAGTVMDEELEVVEGAIADSTNDDRQDDAAADDPQQPGNSTQAVFDDDVSDEEINGNR